MQIHFYRFKLRMVGHKLANLRGKRKTLIFFPHTTDDALFVIGIEIYLIT